jgi:DNA polymerase III sliding clamp (beta) subunit (PCNA family)
MPFDPQDYPDVPALESAPQGETVGTIPAEVWSKAFKGVPRRPVKPVLGTVAAVLGKDQATLVSTDLENANVQSPRLVEGRWPTTDQVFPKGKPRFTVNVDAKLLIDLLQVAMAFSSQDRNNKVTMEFHDRNQPFAIRTRSDEGQEFSGLIVPLVGTEEAQQPRDQAQAA